MRGQRLGGVGPADAQAVDPSPGLLGGSDHGLVLIQDDRARLWSGVSVGRSRGAQVGPDPGCQQRRHVGDELDVLLVVMPARAVPVQVHQRPARPARVELDAHLVADARGTPYLPPAQIAAQVAPGHRGEWSPARWSQALPERAGSPARLARSRPAAASGRSGARPGQRPGSRRRRVPAAGRPDRSAASPTRRRRSRDAAGRWSRAGTNRCRAYPQRG